MISLKDIQYIIRGREVLKKINLEVEEGEYVYVIGGSGNGKTTLLNIIGGLITPNAGEVNIDGISSKEKKYGRVRRDYLSFVLQDYGLLSNETVKVNIELSKKLSGCKEVLPSVEKKIIGKLELDHLLEEPAKNLSGGEVQRVKVAQALLRNTPIILCDEPTSSLDKRLKEVVVEMLDEANELAGKTIIHVTHDLAIVKKDRKILKI